VCFLILELQFTLYYLIFMFIFELHLTLLFLFVTKHSASKGNITLHTLWFTSICYHTVIEFHIVRKRRTYCARLMVGSMTCNSLDRHGHVHIYCYREASLKVLLLMICCNKIQKEHLHTFFCIEAVTWTIMLAMLTI